MCQCWSSPTGRDIGQEIQRDTSPSTFAATTRRRPDGDVPLQRQVRGPRPAAGVRHAEGGRAGPARRDGGRRGPHLGGRTLLGHDVLRRPRALRVHERGVRTLQPRQRAAARHVPERDQVRGRDHRHDPRPARRGSADRRRTGRPRDHRRLGLDRPRRARVPRPRCTTYPHAQPREARDCAPCLRQGLPPLRRRAAGGTGRSGHHPGGHRRRRTAHRQRHDRDRRVGLQLRLRHDRSHRGAGRPRGRPRRGPARRRVPRRVHPPVRPRGSGSSTRASTCRSRG